MKGKERIMKAIQKLYEIYLRHPHITTDSRKVTKRCMFFALKGDRFDGNKFAQQAIREGAAYAIIDNKQYLSNEKCILVEDVLESLQQLANFHRRQFDIPVIAITGSNGKTTTKNLVSTVLGSQYIIHSTKGNYNNHIGVPLTLLDMPHETEIAIIEMGANHLGEIDFLCKIAEPTHGLITNIGKAHLEGFGSLEGVKRGKSELYHFLTKNEGTSFINLDEPYLDELAGNNLQKVYYTSAEAIDSDLLPIKIQPSRSTPFVQLAFLSEHGKRVMVESQLIGAYNLGNIMTSIALGKYFKVPAKKIKQAIEGYIPSNNRSQILKSGTNTFLLDAYNANPTSMKSALDHFSKMEAERKIAILGDMLELGNESISEHQAILDFALTQNFSLLILVGTEFGKCQLNSNFLHFKNTEKLKDWFMRQPFSDTSFLIKGSRGIGLERVLEE